jgi:hypothetical protein
VRLGLPYRTAGASTNTFGVQTKALSHRRCANQHCRAQLRPSGLGSFLRPARLGCSVAGSMGLPSNAARQSVFCAPSVRAFCAPLVQRRQARFLFGERVVLTVLPASAGQGLGDAKDCVVDGVTPKLCKPALLNTYCLQRLRRVELHVPVALLPDAVRQEQVVAPQVRQPALWRFSLRSDEKRCATLMATEKMPARSGSLGEMDGRSAHQHLQHEFEVRGRALRHDVGGERVGLSDARSFYDFGHSRK